MSENSWAMLFKRLMSVLVSAMNIIILPGTRITLMDIAIWSTIMFLVVKALYSIYIR